MAVKPVADLLHSDGAAAPEADARAPAQLHPGDDFDRDVWCVLGVPVDNVDLAQAVNRVEAAARTNRRLSFVTPNVNWLARALRNPRARREILEADLSLADGAPLVLMARLLGTPIRTRAAGSDLFDALRNRPGFAGRRIRVFFFGGRDGAAEAAHAALARERGGLEAAGWLNPGFGDVDAMSGAETIEAINSAKPDFVVVALGAGKGQRWISANRAKLNAPVIAHLGAVVDFTAGRITRAPAWIRRLGCEWAWRIVAEPSLWRRYAGDALALARIMAGRLAPQLVLPRGARTGAPARAAVEQSAGAVVVRLSGDLAGAALADVRGAFRAAAAAGSATLDLSAAGRLGAAFLGLVLMLEKNLPDRAGSLQIAGASRPQARALRANAMIYPAQTRAPETAAAAGRAKTAAV